MIKVALNISKHKPNKASVFFFRERPAFFSDRTSHCSFFRLGNCPTVFLRCHAHFPVMASWVECAYIFQSRFYRFPPPDNSCFGHSGNATEAGFSIRRAREWLLRRRRRVASRCCGRSMSLGFREYIQTKKFSIS